MGTPSAGTNTDTPAQGDLARKAQLHRMVMDKHVCPYGLKARDLLERKGYRVEDHPLTSREETEAFRAEHGVRTTPQIFIDGTRIGGYDALREHFGETVPDKDATSYRPVIAIFAVAFPMAMATASLAGSRTLSGHTITLFGPYRRGDPAHGGRPRSDAGRSPVRVRVERHARRRAGHRQQ